MNIRLFALVMLGFVLGVTLCFSDAGRSQSQTNKGSAGAGQSDAERDLLNEINQARAHPQVYISYLEKLKPRFKGKEYSGPGDIDLMTQEGWSAVEDAISFLRASKPQPPLGMSTGLCMTALAHVKDQSASGSTGHKGADSSFIEQRVKPFGTWQGGIGENLAYGNETARDRVLTWLIDDGFPSRGHRRRIMGADYKVAGVSCGPHPEFGTMCVVTLAGGFSDAASIKPAGSNQNNTNGNTKKPTKPKRVAKRY